MRGIAVWAFLAGVTCSPAWTSEPSPQTTASNPIGLGVLVSADGAERTYALILEGANHFKERRTSFGIRQYGFAQSRLELGSHVGVSFAALSGITLVGLDSWKSGDEGFSPHFGVEPFSLAISWTTSQVRQSFYEWLPMASVGPQFGLAGCRALGLARAGGAIGNLGRGSTLLPVGRLAYGGAALLNCQRFDFGAEVTEIRADVPTLLTAIDTAIPFETGNWRLGLRIESLSYGTLPNGIFSPLPGAGLGERRIMLVFRGNPFDAL